MRSSPAAPRRRLDGVARPVGVITLVAIVGLLSLPFVTTFNEFLTRLAITVGLDRYLADWVAPSIAGLLRGALALLGFGSSTDGSILSLGRDGRYASIFISWNCVGWQTLVLFIVSAVAGLQGQFTRSSRYETLVLGLMGVFLLNIGRILIVALVAWAFGQGPAILVHDYGSLILSVGYLFAFWAMAYQGVLEPASPSGRALEV